MMPPKTKRLLLLIVILLLAVPALATTGTSFDETWNRASGETCAGSAACINLWVTTAGSTSSITAASACAATGWDGTNALKLASAATNNRVITYGTIPLIPSGADYDIYFEACWDSTTWQSTGFISFQDSSAQESFSVATNNSGSGQFYANGITTFPSSGVAVSTRHLFHMNRASNVCKVQIDGGSYTTFTCNNYDLTQVAIKGFNTGAALYIGHIYVDSASYPSGSTASVNGWPPSAFTDFASMTGTPTAAKLYAGTHCGNANTSKWTQSSTSGLSFTTSTGGTTFPANLSACGTNYTGNTNISFEMDVTTAAGSGGYWTVQQNTAYASAAWGFEFWFTGGPTQNGVGLDFGAIRDTNGTINYVQLKGVSGNNQLSFENNYYSCSTTLAVNLSAGTHYWITWGVSADGVDTVYLYTRSTMALLGSIVSTTCNANGDRAVALPGAVYFDIGKTGNETINTATQVFYTNIIYQFANVSNPILPPVVSSRCLGCDLSLVQEDKVIAYAQ